MNKNKWWKFWRGEPETTVQAPRGRPSSGFVRSFTVKAYRPQDVMPTLAAGKAIATEYNATTAVDSGLKNSVWAYRSVTLIAQTTAAVPWRVMKIDSHGDWQPAPHSQYQRLIDKPNKTWSRNRLIQEAVYSLELAGESFISKKRARIIGESQSVIRRDSNGVPVLNEAGEKIPAGLPRELWVLPPDKLKPIMGGAGKPLVTGYEAKTGKPAKVAASEIMQPMYINPANPARGLAPFRVAMNDVDTYTKAAVWQKSAFDNMGVPTGMFKLKEYVELDTETADGAESGWTKTLTELKDQYLGAQNAKVPMVMGQDIDWVQLSASMVDMDFQGGCRLLRENIVAAFGVPPIMVGILDRSTFSNFSQAELWFWKSKILPLLDMIQDEFNLKLSPEYGREYRIEYDISGIDALIPLYKERVETADKFLARGMPWSVANKKFNLGLEEWDGWDIGLVPAGLVNITDFKDLDV